jgi:hypothetical protein
VPQENGTPFTRIATQSLLKSIAALSPASKERTDRCIDEGVRPILPGTRAAMPAVPTLALTSDLASRFTSASASTRNQHAHGCRLTTEAHVA